MKTDSLQHLLERYREGALGEDELAELQRLTHRDDVVSHARQRADAIVRRRRAVVASVAGLLLAGATVWALLPSPQSAPIVAEASVPEAPAAVPEPVVEQPAAEVPASPQPTRRKATRPRSAAQEPVVMCNSQCEADSVINDIWKFLTV